MFPHLIYYSRACRYRGGNRIIATNIKSELRMANRGRPTKILTQNDIEALEQFLQQLPFLKKNQQQAFSLLSQSHGPYSETQLKLLKTVDREKKQYQTRHALIEQIQLKQKNQQPLYANEIEILGLLQQDMDQDHFFRLDRALESYQKIEKATLEDRIRVEKEDRRELLKKTNKQLTEAQKKRNAENQLKYALGGMLQSLCQKLQWNISQTDMPWLEQKILQSMIYQETIQNTQVYREIKNITQDQNEINSLFHKIVEELPKFKLDHQEMHKALINRLHKRP